MSDYEEGPLEVTMAANGHQSSSLLELLRAKRAAHVASEAYYLEVPGYDGLLELRCGPLPSGTLARLRAKFERSRSVDREFDFAADMLLAVCVDVLARPTQSAPFVPIDLEEPMRIDERLAEGLGLEAASGRELVRQLFGAVPVPEVATAEAMSAYLEWAGAIQTEGDEAFVGES